MKNTAYNHWKYISNTNVYMTLSFAAARYTQSVLTFDSVLGTRARIHCGAYLCLQDAIFMWLLAPTGALIVMIVYKICIQANFSDVHSVHWSIGLFVHWSIAQWRKQ